VTNGNATYQERNSIETNVGEERFLAYCESKGVTVHRLGFDEKRGKVARFFSLPDAVRLLPDFVVENDNKIVLVEVKGSANFKRRDYDRIDWLVSQFTNAETMLVFAFALPDGIEWLTPGEVKELFELSTHEGVWPDGVKYRTINFGGLS
jgi:hypothetical protein